MIRKKAFTLIELLIVVAIIAILAAIAVPNFLEAQTRSKVARAKADMRSLATAIEAYAVDYNRAPLGTNERWIILDKYYPQLEKAAAAFSALTTPIAYITVICEDPFGERINVTAGGQHKREGRALMEYKYNMYLPPQIKTAEKFKDALTANYVWCLTAFGPAKKYGNPKEWPMFAYEGDPSGPYEAPTNIYDATNGTTSLGIIIRTNKGEYTGP